MTAVPESLPERSGTGERWLLLLWAVVMIVIGGLLIFRPAPTALIWVQVMAWFWLIGGIFDVVGSIMERADGWGWRLAGGVIGILAGLYIVGSPIIGAVAAVQVFFYVLVFTAIFNGVINVIGGIGAPRSWGRVILGGFQIFLGGWLLFHPLIGLLAFVPALGVIMVVGGIIALIASFALS
jgi:uncharacterized membrane protein HdeD (DUF308 family)